MDNQGIIDRALEAIAPVLQFEPVPNRSGTTHLKAALPEAAEHIFEAQVRLVARVQTLRTLKALDATASMGEEEGADQLLIAPFISPTMADECRRLCLNFIDTSGNAFIRVPGCHVFITGIPRRDDAQAKATVGMWSRPSALRVIFNLLTQRALVDGTQRDIAEAAGVSLGSVGPVIKDLENLGFLTRGIDSPRRMLAQDTLETEWATHYSVTLREKLNGKRYKPLTENWWKDAHLDAEKAQWGGEVAAFHQTSYLKPTEATIYSKIPRSDLIVLFRLKPDPKGSVEVLDAFWPLSKSIDPPTVPPLLVYADLLASRDDRTLEAAQLVLKRLRDA
ncbi:type IV toxin-antitoxin system AbiEi family antitoxin [Acidovorax sp.]|uniref:type IV toxin-antitoxin system AbiEi family antitoxin n=1 Tax=Acidovorax sp. TaxID=1872122 RepID=UPI00391FAAC0